MRLHGYGVPHTGLSGDNQFFAEAKIQLTCCARLDSRLRGNDVGEGGNGNGRCGEDNGEVGNDNREVGNGNGEVGNDNREVGNGNGEDTNHTGGIS